MLRSKALLAGLLACGMVSAEGVKVRTSIIAHTLSQAASYGVIWDTPRSVWMPKCAIPPKLDGSPDDDCWKEAALLTGFIASPTNRNRPYKNHVRLCYDEDHLYLGGRFEEPRPGCLLPGGPRSGAPRPSAVHLRRYLEGRQAHGGRSRWQDGEGYRDQARAPIPGGAQPLGV